MKKIGALYTIGILLATSAANCAAQNGCENCTATAAIPTLPQWCAIVMGLVLIGLSIFVMRRSNASKSRGSHVVQSDESRNVRRFDSIAR